MNSALNSSALFDLKLGRLRILLILLTGLCFVCSKTHGVKQQVSSSEPLHSTDFAPKRESRIIGGTPVDGSEYPWIVSLRLCSLDCAIVKPHLCGGSVFDVSTRTWILTAAHCLEPVEYLIALYNAHYSDDCDFHLYADISRTDTNSCFQTDYTRVEIHGWQIHDGFNAPANDVAVVWSFQNVSVQPVTLQPSAPCCVADDLLRVIGYGADTDTQPTETLEYVDITYVTQDACEDMLYEKYGSGDLVFDGMLCAYDEGEAVCKGDSGGPLIRGTDKNSTQVGIVNGYYGDYCGQQGFPSIYADVGFYYDWIMEICDCESETRTTSTQMPTSTTQTHTSTTETPISSTEFYYSSSFRCNDGCVIAAWYVDDDWCDCGECEDETNWNCDSCRGCPSVCRLFVRCLGTDVPTTTTETSVKLTTSTQIPTTTKTLMTTPKTTLTKTTTKSPTTTVSMTPTTTVTSKTTKIIKSTATKTPTATTQKPSSTMKMPSTTETLVTTTKMPTAKTSTTETLTSTTNIPTFTTETPTTSTTELESSGFTCDDGCVILELNVDDDYCDCSECEDETIWSCESCVGCPTDCGGSVKCWHTSQTTMQSITSQTPTETTTTTEPSVGYMCDDGCVIVEEDLDNGYCDCSECEDEPSFSCESCPGCPSNCGSNVYCMGTTHTPATTTTKMSSTTSITPITTVSLTSTKQKPTSTTETPTSSTELESSGFTCDDGCVILEWYVDDDWCDCGECEDETNWNCDSCPGCPSVCGLYVICVGTDAPTTTMETPSTTVSLPTTTKTMTTMEIMTTTTKTPTSTAPSTEIPSTTEALTATDTTSIHTFTTKTPTVATTKMHSTTTMAPITTMATMTTTTQMAKSTSKTETTASTSVLHTTRTSLLKSHSTTAVTPTSTSVLPLHSTSTTESTPRKSSSTASEKHSSTTTTKTTTLISTTAMTTPKTKKQSSALSALQITAVSLAILYLLLMICVSAFCWCLLKKKKEAADAGDDDNEVMQILSERRRFSVTDLFPDEKQSESSSPTSTLSSRDDSSEELSREFWSDF